MVKKLILLRHAEASSEADKDFNRPLTGNGQRAARHLAQWFEENDITIDRIYSSSAIRAISTAEILAERLGVSVKKEEELYESSVRIFLRLINETNAGFDVVLYLGHNPTITYLGEYLTGEPLNMEPAGATIIDLDTRWQEVSEKSGTLVQYLSPAVYAP